MTTRCREELLNETCECDRQLDHEGPHRCDACGQVWEEEEAHYQGCICADCSGADYNEQ